MAKKVFFSVSIIAAAAAVIIGFGTRIQQAEERLPASASAPVTQAGIVQAAAPTTPHAKAAD